MGQQCSRTNTYYKNSCCCKKENPLKQRSKSLDLSRPTLKIQKPRFKYVKEKKLIKLKQWLLEKNDQNLIRNEEFAVLVNKAQENMNTHLNLDDQHQLTQSDFDYVLASNRESNRSPEKTNIHSLKQKFSTKYLTVQRKIKTMKLTQSSNKKNKNDLRRIKRKQVISQLSMVKRNSIDKKTIEQIEVSCLRRSNVLGEAIKSLSAEKNDRDIITKTYVFN